MNEKQCKMYQQELEQALKTLNYYENELHYGTISESAAKIYIDSYRGELRALVKAGKMLGALDAKVNVRHKQIKEHSTSRGASRNHDSITYLEGI